MTNREQSDGAFTLLEVLVAATVAVLVVGGALAVVANALAWNGRVSGRQQARAEALRVLDRVAADLMAMCRMAGSEIGLAATLVDGTGTSGLWEADANGQPGGRVEVDGDEVATMRFGVGGVWLRFIAQAAGSEAEDGAVPRVIAYQIIRRRAPSAAGPRYWLHRAVVRAGETEGRPGMWEAGGNLDPAAASSFMRTGPGNDGSVAGDPFAVVRPGAAENLFAEGVVDFGVRFLEPAGNGSWRVIFPLGPADRDTLAPRIDPYPQAVDLLVRVLTPEGARRLAAFENGAGIVDAGATWWALVAANSEVLTRRIYLPGGTR